MLLGFLLPLLIFLCTFAIAPLHVRFLILEHVRMAR